MSAYAAILQFLAGTAFGFCLSYGVTWLDRWLEQRRKMAEPPFTRAYAPMAWKYGMRQNDWAGWTCKAGHVTWLSAMHDQHAEPCSCPNCGKPGEVTRFERREASL